MELVKRYVKVAVLVALGIAGIAFLLSIVVDWNVIDNKFKIVGDSVLVEDRFAPKSTADAEDAPTISLLPNRTSKNAVPTITSRSDARDIAAAVGPFLRRWETFDPSRAVVTVHGNPYRSALAPYVSRARLGAVTAREESMDPPGVCTGYSSERFCVVASEWVGPNDITDAITIHDLDDNSAYVTLHGVVRYRGDPDRAPRPHLLETPYFRAYGLYLTKDDGRWQVVRAAAETLDRIG